MSGVSKHDWLLLIHVAGAFAVLAGALLAVVLNQAALRHERPSEIALLLRLTRVAVVLIGVGMVVTLAFGLWLASDQSDLDEAWIAAAIALWLLAVVLGSVGGRRDRHTRELAEQLALSGDRPNPELHSRLRDPVSVALSYGSGLAVLAILVLMIWRPGG
jgi:uncharacterized membrane protein